MLYVGFLRYFVTGMENCDMVHLGEISKLEYYVPWKSHTLRKGPTAKKIILEKEKYKDFVDKKTQPKEIQKALSFSRRIKITKRCSP